MSDKKFDKGYKRLFSKKRNFLKLLQSFVNQKWVDQLKESDLTLTDKEFVLQDFSGRESDIIYKVDFSNSSVYFYIVQENQSSVDFTMPVRLLVYLTEVLKREFLDADSDKRELKDFRLPSVFPKCCKMVQLVGQPLEVLEIIN